MAEEAKIGIRVRTYREKLGMSIEELAVKSAISSTVLESIEKGDVLPALGILARIARSLGLRLGTFLDDQYRADPIITRGSELERDNDKNEMGSLGYSSRSLAVGKSDRHMDPFYIEFAPGHETLENSHEGEELIICKKGRIELTYGKEKHVLEEGDTAYYNSVVKHTLRALDNKEAVIYGIVFIPF